MVRHRLTDQQWELVQDLFLPPARTGRPRRDRREILDAVSWILRTGAPWRDLPIDPGGPSVVERMLYLNGQLTDFIH
ncbi:Putative transposase of IS4/5 family [Singulisphaera sp. GP187]|uniref:IS5 family transposase n=1 Tax=Singulisphaera sp. GP187 TaxID=1882752 RepID=UPI000926B3C3|nr:Putative transposase of IS4/5 family [Singulisphaera sp. GP187]